MKLKNKKTGEIVEDFSYILLESTNYKTYHSLAELNEEWEDYEEPKEYWHIAELCGGLQRKQDTDNGEDRFNKKIGNYFETEEEAEKAVEKLKAWKRLKDNGFKFVGWKRDERYCGDYTIEAEDFTSCEDNDLELLFGGEK